MNEKLTTRLPVWTVILIIISTVAIVLYFTRTPEPVEVKTIERTKKAKELIKKIDNEKIVIPDTTYDAMRKYVTDKSCTAGQP